MDAAAGTAMLATVGLLSLLGIVAWAQHQVSGYLGLIDWVLLGAVDAFHAPCAGTARRASPCGCGIGVNKLRWGLGVGWDRRS